MVDFNTLTLDVIGVLATVVYAYFKAWEQSHIKDATAATTLDNAVKNSLGVIQQAAAARLQTHPLQLTLPALSAPVAAGVQYVIDQAGPEIKRFGEITTADIAAKVLAKQGLSAIAAAPAPVVLTPGLNATVPPMPTMPGPVVPSATTP